MSDVKLHNIQKSFGCTRVIEALNLSVDDGSFTVFVGPSGCGKSTLLRIVAGLEDVSAGEIRIGGRNVTGVGPVERGVAMVFQNYALYPHMTVEKNIGFGLRMAGKGEAEIAKSVNEAASALQLQALLKRRPGELSGGQRQRVAIGRAIVRNPEVFLFDEPLSNLDAELRVSMRVELAKLHQRIGATMIYVTHDQTEAMTLADRIVVMRGGNIEQAGSPETLYSDPDGIFVAGFIGSPRMNFLDATLDENGMVQFSGGGSFAAGGGFAKIKQAIKVGIRPEYFTGEGESDGSLRLKVDVVENLGSTRYVYGSLPSGENLIAEDRVGARLRSGDVIDIRFVSAKALLFSTDGARLRPLQ